MNVLDRIAIGLTRLPNTDESACYKLNHCMDNWRRFLSSELFLAAVPPSIMLYFAIRRERDFDDSIKEMTLDLAEKRHQIDGHSSDRASD